MDAIEEAAGQVIRERRNERGVSLDVLAELTGQTKGNLSNLERGLYSWSLARWCEVAAKLRADPGKLLSAAVKRARK